jgi:hypothetical protein
MVTAKAHPWAADVALIIMAIAAGFSVMAPLFLAARKLLGMGATSAEVAGLLDRKINGALVRIEAAQATQGAQLAELDRKVDGHGERLASLEGRLDLRHQVRGGRTN